MSINKCLHDVVGLTRGECACVQDYEEDYSRSLSGYYVDEVQGMALRGLDNVGGCRPLWEKMIAARDNAISRFRTDALIAIEKYKEKVRTPFSGDIGSKSQSGLAQADTYYGLRMFAESGKFILRAVTLLGGYSGSVTLEIYDEYDLLYAHPLNAVASKPAKTDIITVELPLEGNLYFLVSGGQPYRNKLTCGCGGYSWCFTPQRPVYRSSRDRWTEWAMVGGVTGDDINDRESWRVDSRSYGMILHGNFLCDTSEMFCSDASDFINNPIDNAIAQAIMYKTAEMLTVYIMDSPEVNRFTLLKTEALAENRAFYAENYAIMIDFIAENIEHECYRCRQPFGITKRAHLL